MVRLVITILLNGYFKLLLGFSPELNHGAPTTQALATPVRSPAYDVAVVRSVYLGLLFTSCGRHQYNDQGCTARLSDRPQVGM